MDRELKNSFGQLRGRRGLSRDQARRVFRRTMAGELPEGAKAIYCGDAMATLNSWRAVAGLSRPNTPKRGTQA